MLLFDDDDPNTPAAPNAELIPFIYIYIERDLSDNTMLALPILYDVWHRKGGSGGCHTLRNSRALVLQ